MSWEAPTAEMARPAPGVLAALEVSPAPTEIEAVAIMAAMEALWPKPVLVERTDQRGRPEAWRFSGRWWARPVAASRARPWY